MDSILPSTNKKSFDVIVIGVGSMGSSACYFLAQRGYSVLGLEQFSISHEYGSHAGQSRIIRKAYFEDPGYVPLLNRAYENWKTLEEETGNRIYYRTGLVYFGDRGSLLMQGVKQSAALYDIPLENLAPSLATKWFPPFKVPGDFEILFEYDAGFVTPEKGIQLYAKQAIKNGAEIHTTEKVVKWNKEDDHIEVISDKNKYYCKKLIITAGAWAGKMIPGMNHKIRITRQFVAWIKTRNPSEFAFGNFPCWMIADDIKPGAYYGFPILPADKFGEPAGLKLAHHYPGDITEPNHVNRQKTEKDEENVKYALNKYLPGAFDSFLSSKICLYANTPDENFVIDKLPRYENHVTIACGFSGHGFKFASVVGEILADLAIEGKTKEPIEFLNAKRLQ
jgi:sarcosine oxidase